MQVLTGGLWGLAVRGLATAAFRTLPLMALLFLPVLLGLHDIYGWSQRRARRDGRLPSQGAVSQRPVLHRPRRLLFRGLWSRRRAAAALVARAGERRPCRRGSPRSPRERADRLRALHEFRLDRLGHVARSEMVFHDLRRSSSWPANSSPRSRSSPRCWRSSRGDPSLGDAIPRRSFTISATCSSRSSFSGPTSRSRSSSSSGRAICRRRSAWYLDRSRGGWQWFAVVLAVCQFLLPFLLLLSRAAKRNRAALGRHRARAFSSRTSWTISGWSRRRFIPRAFYVHWLDVAEFFALGGFWFALFFYFLKQQPLAPGLTDGGAPDD